MKKTILLALLILATASCFIALAYGYGSTTTVTPNPATPGSLVTATWTPTPDNPSTTVEFKWYDPSNNLMRDSGPLSVSPTGTPVSDHYTLSTSAPLGTWTVTATAAEGTTQISFEVAPFTVAVPEIAALGTIGAAFAMIGAVVFRKRASNKT
jgi:hypothetical protein